MGEFTNFSKIKADDGVIMMGDTEITEADVEAMDGITPGVVEANKAVVVDADKHIDTIVIADGGLKLGATTGTAVTSTAAELNLLDGSVAGTTVASKAVVVDADKRVDTIVVGTLALGAGAGTAITPTADEINLLAQGVAAGYKVARGTVTPTMAAEAVASGLTTVVAVVASLKGDPTLTHMWVSAVAGTPDDSTFTINSWKPTAANDVTPIAATTPWSEVDWIAIGT